MHRGGWNLVQASTAEGMAAQHAPERQSNAAQRSVSGNRYSCILRAGRLIAASSRAQRVHRRRKPAAIKSQRGEQNLSHHAGETMPGRGPGRADLYASAFACVRIRTISASSFVKSIVSTIRRGCRMRSELCGSRSRWRRRASRMRRLMRLRSWAFPSTLPAVRPTREPGGRACSNRGLPPHGLACGARNQLIDADWRLRLAP
jgi:hypothetical protein